MLKADVLSGKGSVGAWDKDVPVEVSNQVFNGEPQFFTPEVMTVPAGSLTMMDLFSGAGGFSCGASWAGFIPVFGLDYLEPAAMTWRKNHPNAISCVGDIRQVNPEAVKVMLADKGVHQIHVITGGVPCQGFSKSNRKHIDDDPRNFLFLEYMRFVKAFTPDYIILENVGGLRSTAGGQFEQEIKRHMDDLGYSVSVKLVNAADFGVPQTRQRLIFIGVKTGRGLAATYEFPAGNFTAATYRTVEDALSDLPVLTTNEQATAYNSIPTTGYQKLMRDVGSIGISEPTSLTNHVAPNHTAETIAMIAATEPGKPLYDSFKQRIRLAPNKPSVTVLSGGIRPQWQLAHPTQPRGLTVRETARLQSFPDSYVFLGGTTQERVQVGNAVPPLLAYELVKPIAGDIRKRDTTQQVSKIAPTAKTKSNDVIKLFIAGSPCTKWSNANNARETEPTGIGWELFMNCLIGIERFQPDFILYENNKGISLEIKDEICKRLGYPLQYINSGLVSAQRRERFYVHNIPGVGQPEDCGLSVADILDDGKPHSLTTSNRPKVFEPIRVGCIGSNSQGYRVYSYQGKSVTLAANSGGIGSHTGLYAIPVDAPEGITGSKIGDVFEVMDGFITYKGEQHAIKLPDGYYAIRKLSVSECKRLQTIPDSFDMSMVTKTQAYKMLGNGWTVDVIAHILSHIPGIQDKEVEVLSMYDGISCGRIALDKLGVKVKQYYAYEIDEHAIAVSTANYPAIIRCGDAFGIRDMDFTPKSISTSEILTPRQRTIRETRSLVMRSAWDTAKTAASKYGGSSREYIGEALRMTWAGIKAQALNTAA